MDILAWMLTDGMTSLNMTTFEKFKIESLKKVVITEELY